METYYRETEILEKLRFPVPVDYETIGRITVAAILQQHPELEDCTDEQKVQIRGSVDYEVTILASVKSPVTLIPICVCVGREPNVCCVGTC